MEVTNLPAAFINQFKNMQKNIEARQYKKALNMAENILKANPNHGETLACKGLIQRYMDSKDDAYKSVNEGLKKAITSYIPWYCLSQLQIKDQDYASALKCFIQALRLVPASNTTVVFKLLSEIVPLQIQARDYKGLLDTRIKLLNMKSGVKPFWLGLSLAQYLNKNFDAALKALDHFLDSIGKELMEQPYEYSEIVSFRCFMLRESGEHKRLLDYLNTVKDFALDKSLWLEDKAWAMIKGNSMDAASHTYLELLKLNSENHSYLSGYQQAKKLTSSTTQAEKGQEQALLDLYSNLSTQFPDSSSIKRIPLNFANGEEFRKRLEEFVKPYIRKTIPSLFSVLKSLYSDKDKITIIEQVFLSYLTSLETSSKFPNEDKVESPSTLLWVYIYLAYHYDRLSNSEMALQYIDKAIVHTPTVVELYLCKGRLLKHAGNRQAAAESVDQARKIDLADRYLNTKTTKYLLGADKFEDAEKMISIFAKNIHQDPEQLHNVHEMQSMWFEIEAGRCFMRRKEYGRALKQFNYIIKHFNEVQDDQFDFHNYCLRRCILRSYCEMLKFEDRVRGHAFYFKAATGLVETYLILHDDANAKNVPKPEDDYNKKKDDDWYGEKLLAVASYMDEALKYVKVMEEFSASKLETHTLATQVYLRKKNFASAIKALVQAHKLDAQNATVQQLILTLVEQASKESNLDCKQALEDAKKEWLANNKTVEQILTGLTGSGKVADALAATIVNASNVNALLAATQGALADYEAAYSYLTSVLKDEKNAAAFKALGNKAYPKATAFSN